jgi:hypothetical protein
MTITLTREEAQQVLKDLEGEIPFYSENDCNTPEWITNAIELLQARLAQPEPEPVAWHEPGAYSNVTVYKQWAEENGWLPLYKEKNT